LNYKFEDDSRQIIISITQIDDRIKVECRIDSKVQAETNFPDGSQTTPKRGEEGSNDDDSQTILKRTGKHVYWRASFNGNREERGT
jgi:hypothetical protein